MSGDPVASPDGTQGEGPHLAQPATGRGGSVRVGSVRVGSVRGGSVQSLARAFDILEAMADAGGSVSLSQLAGDVRLPLPTIHRLIRTLVDLGYVRQEPSRRYTLGPKLIRLGETSSRMLRTWARPYLTELVDRVGETTNLAMLDNDLVVYVAQVPSRHSMRMFTEVGRRVLPHCTAVGKAILARLGEDEVRGLLRRTGMEPRTAHTITDPGVLLAELAHVRAQGYAVDNGEQEVGVRCVAVAVPGAPTPIALSVSGPTTRMTPDVVARAAPLLTNAAHRLASDLAAGAPAGE